jgi:hypothetical protein
LGGIGVWTQGFVLAKQAFYHLSHWTGTGPVTIILIVKFTTFSSDFILYPQMHWLITIAFDNDSSIMLCDVCPRFPSNPAARSYLKIFCAGNFYGFTRDITDVLSWALAFFLWALMGMFLSLCAYSHLTHRLPDQHQPLFLLVFWTSSLLLGLL